VAVSDSCADKCAWESSVACKNGTVAEKSSCGLAAPEVGPLLGLTAEDSTILTELAAASKACKAYATEDACKAHAQGISATAAPAALTFP
jgi:hypothetical protein